MLKKILTIFIVLSISLFISLGFLVSKKTSSYIKEEILHNAEISMDESYRAINNIVSSAKDTALEIAINSTVQEVLKAIENNDSNYDLYLEKISKYLDEYPGNHSIYTSISVYIPSIKSNNYHRNIYEYIDEEWINNALLSPNNFLWSLHSNEQSTILRQAKCIYSSDDYNKIIGVINIDINVNTIRSIASVANEMGNRLYLVDDKGSISYPLYNYDHIPEEILKASEDGEYEIDNNLILVRKIKTTGWNLIKTISVSIINNKVNEIYKTILNLACVFALLAFGLALFFNKKFLDPVNRLANKMKGVQAGELSKITKGPKDGEVATLYSSYNLMIDRIDEEIKNNYLSQIREKDAELRALQAQINPHFLYNTLDSINWLALKYKAKDISKMVISLSDMLRLSLNKGKNILTIKDELRQVESYIELQKVRYSDCFDYKIEADEEVLDRKILKMLLQPIVENAIIHGFEDIDSGGLIIIRVVDKKDVTYFEVENNGKLIDLDDINNRLNNYDKEENRKGYGIINVNERIQALYGVEYSINYLIRDNHTIAYFQIPTKEIVNESFNR